MGSRNLFQGEGLVAGKRWERRTRKKAPRTVSVSGQGGGCWRGQGSRALWAADGEQKGRPEAKPQCLLWVEKCNPKKDTLEP